MLHKIREMCDKIDSIKMDSDRLRKLKYESPKGTTQEINHLIEQIQFACGLISRDKGTYKKDK
jgi:hypothetical protein